MKRLLSIAAVVLTLVSAGLYGYGYVTTSGRARECQAALRVGMGDSGAAEAAAVRSPACAQLSDDELARVRARVEVRLLREQAP